MGDSTFMYKGYDDYPPRLVLSFHIFILIAFGSLIFPTLLPCYAVEIPPAPPSAVWISTPDCQWVSYFLPLDSENTIEAAFDMWQRIFNTKRVYWRGSQIGLWIEDNNYLVRNEYFEVSRGVFPWWKHLINEVGTNRLAIEAAHKRNMEIWMNDGLFEHGCAGADLGFPGHVEDRLRIQHPEWIPVDRHGLRRQGGPIEFAYPEARAILVKRYAEHCLKHNYDGIMFYTYVENFSMRYQDEFGFNEPIVSEYKNSCGKDIRTEPFDKMLWAKIRGEYVTTFLRELKEELSKNKKGLGVVIYRRYDNGHYPAKWLACPGGAEVSLAGRIYLDWETWIKEDIVDDLMFYGGLEDPTFMDRLFDIAEGSNCLLHFSAASIWDDKNTVYVEKGARPCLYPYSGERQYGYTIDLPAESIPSKDPYQRLRVLWQVAQLRNKVDIEEIRKATCDENVYIRRAALQALMKLKDVGSLGVIESCLDDKENSVRCAAASALGPIRGSNSVEKIFNTLRKHGNFMLVNEAAATLGYYLDSHFEDVARGIRDESYDVKMASVKALAKVPEKSQCEQILIDLLYHDHDDYVRNIAIESLSRNMNERVIKAFIDCAKSDTDNLSRRAIEKASLMLQEEKMQHLSKLYSECFSLAVDMFGKYGDGGLRTDDSWGWRPLGNSILEAFGDKGKEELYDFWKNTENQNLSQRAFMILFVRQDPQNLNLITEEEALTLYSKALKEKEMWPWHNPNKLRRQ